MSTLLQVVDPAGVRARTSGGLDLLIRPVGDGDEGALFALFATISPEDLRYRFLSAVRGVSASQVNTMVHVDHDRTEHLLAWLDDEKLVGSAMLAADAAGDTAEVAIAVAGDHREQGIAWALMTEVIRLARTRGIRRLQTIESAENFAAIKLERERGFSARPLPDDPSLVLLELDVD